MHAAAPVAMPRMPGHEDNLPVSIEMRLLILVAKPASSCRNATKNHAGCAQADPDM